MEPTNPFQIIFTIPIDLRHNFQNQMNLCLMFYSVNFILDIIRYYLKAFRNKIIFGFGPEFDIHITLAQLIYCSSAINCPWSILSWPI